MLCMQSAIIRARFKIFKSQEKKYMKLSMHKLCKRLGTVEKRTLTYMGCLKNQEAAKNIEEYEVLTLHHVIIHV